MTSIDRYENSSRMACDDINIRNLPRKYSGDLLNFFFILIITLIIYLPFLGLPAWDGNEPIRAIVSKGMLKTGNYFAPILHGQPYFVKPPLMNWLIAASGRIFGEVNEWTARLPSVLMVFATSIMLYILPVRWLRGGTNFFAALAFLTMIGIMGKGRVAEIDSLFIFLVTVNLLVWIYGYTSNWKGPILWSVSLSLLAVSFLSKGPQAIVLFYSTVFAYLLVKRKLKLFFSFSHLIGLVFFGVILACYMLSVLKWVRFDEYIAMWRDQILQRTIEEHSSFFEHFVLYPLRILPQFMPWILFVLPVVIVKELRDKLAEVTKNELFVFSLVMLAANIPLYWLLPNARVRYVLPSGPFIAIATALLFELYMKQAEHNPKIIIYFRRIMKYIAVATLLSVITVVPFLLLFGMKITLVLILLLSAISALSLTLIRFISAAEIKPVLIYLSLITGLIFLVYTELDIRHDMKKEYYPRKVSREILNVLPGDADPVYEIGYDRFLRITYYLERDVVQLDSFTQLKKAGIKGKVYFIFDTDFLNKITTEEDRKIFLHDVSWKKLYTGRFAKDKNEIVVGYLE